MVSGSTRREEEEKEEEGIWTVRYMTEAAERSPLGGSASRTGSRGLAGPPKGAGSDENRQGHVGWCIAAVPDSAPPLRTRSPTAAARSSHGP